jgi:hypothetical protein
MVMEHAEALEQIEVAAVEPKGLDRLMAGDTAISVAVAGHLAGCPSCVAELARVRRSAAIAREVIRSEPDPALRDRTLAFVRAVGRDREAVVPEPVIAGPGIEVATEAGGSPPEGLAQPVPGAIRRPPRWPWLAAAAAVVIAVGLGFVAGTLPLQDDVARKTAEIGLLQETSEYAVAIAAQPDALRVDLAPTAAAPGATGTVMLAPGTGELVAVAHALAPPGPDEEYGCWVEVAGQRQRLGRMYPAGDLWTWAGAVDDLGDLPAGATFGVSVGPKGGGAGATPVLTGSL